MKDLWGSQMFFLEMLGEINKGFVFFNIGAVGSDNGCVTGVNPKIMALAAGLRQFVNCYRKVLAVLPEYFPDLFYFFLHRFLLRIKIIDFIYQPKRAPKLHITLNFNRS